MYDLRRYSLCIECPYSGQQSLDRGARQETFTYLAAIRHARYDKPLHTHIAENKADITKVKRVNARLFYNIKRQVVANE